MFNQVNFTNAPNLDSLGSDAQDNSKLSNIESFENSKNNNVDGDILSYLKKIITEKENELAPLNELLKNDDYWYKLRNDYIDRNFGKTFWDWFPLTAGISGLVKAGQGKKEADRLWSDKISQRDVLLKQLEDLKAQKFSYMSNIAAQKEKYKVEQDALKKVGITNSYFMLKNGTLAGSTPFSFANAGSPNYQSSKGDSSKISDIFKMLIALIASGAKIGKLFT